MLEVLKYGLDVLASAESVGFEVGATALIVADVEASDGDGVLSARIGIGDAEVGIDTVLGEILDLEARSTCALTADVDLFLA